MASNDIETKKKFGEERAGAFDEIPKETEAEEEKEKEEEGEEGEEREEEKEVEEEEFEEFPEEAPSIERRAPILAAEKRIEKAEAGKAEGEENLEEKLKGAPGAPGEAGKEKKEERPHYIFDYEGHRLYQELEVAEQRRVGAAPERIFEKPTRHELELITPMERKAEFEPHEVKEIMMPEHIEYKTEKGFLEFNPLKELKGHGREELKKYRRHET